MKVESPNEMFEDILLIHQTLLGSQVAFEKLVIKYRHKISALVASYVKNSADAEDLTQEVFLKAYQNLSSLKDHRQFSFWLKQIARNHCTDWLRRQRENHLSFEEIKVAETTKMVSPISSGFTTSPEEIALRKELREIVWQAIDSLLEIDRRLIEARYLENASLKQLQADYGLSYCAIAGRLKRAKQKVRETVQKLLGGFFALPGREILEKLFLGGIEVVKLSLKAKLVTVTTIAVLGFGGAGVWHWYSKPAPQKNTVVHQQEMKATSAPAEKKVVIEKPAPKDTSQAQPAKPPVQSEKKKQEEISDEEWVELEQWLAEMEQSDEQSAEDTNLSQKESSSPPVPTDKQIELSLLREGMTLFDQERFEEAATKFDEYLLKFPNSKFAWNVAFKSAFCRNQLGRYDEALSRYESYITNYPETPYIEMAYLHMGHIYEHQDFSTKALENYRLALQHSDNPQIQEEIQLLIDRVIRSNMK